MKYTAGLGFDHDKAKDAAVENTLEEGVGILLVNLGTPDAAEPSAVKRYLKQFLGDPRVVETNRLLWWFALNWVILNIRPKKSAHAYQTVWMDEGSPLMVHSLQQAEKLQAAFSAQTGTPVSIELAMTYGKPAIAQAMCRLRDKKCGKIFVLPLYPQYSGSTTGAVSDAVFEVLKTWRRVPDLRLLTAYHDEPDYIQALAASVRQHWDKHGQAEQLMMSFHGIPQRYFDNGDPYPCHCRKTARLLAEALDLKEGQWKITFQSIFGREAWIKPYTAATLKAWGAEGIQNVDVICPGFAADCLETLEEIQVENKAYFIEAGGQDLRYIPALNASDAHISMLEALVKRECAGWL
ncbi:MAG: ferrochelatase [Mariprofundaceae bacterium]|nr:ferrochelatase [Mariprofundaceae bacterium]